MTVGTNTSYNSASMDEIVQRRSNKATSENENFFKIFDKKVNSNGSNVVKDVTKNEVEEFKKQLTSMGATAFWANLNQEKIQEKIEQKRQELAEQMGLNDENNQMTDEQKTTALEDLNKMLEEYIEELMDKLQNKTSNQEYGQQSPLSNLLSSNFL